MPDDTRRKFSHRWNESTVTRSLAVAAMIPLLVAAFSFLRSPPAPACQEEGKSTAPPDRKTVHRFASLRSGTPVVLSRFGEGPGPSIEKGLLKLVKKRDAGKQINVAAFDQTVFGLYEVVTASFDLRILEGGEGGAFALLNTDHYGSTGAGPEIPAWEEPNLAGSFGIGFDLSNPHNEDWFKGSGNFYNRPQREISLHWNGTEIANRLSSIEFRGPKPHGVDLEIRFETGGAFVDLRIDKTDIFKDHFIPEMFPFPWRAAFGARTGATGTEFHVDGLEVGFSRLAGERPPPRTVRVFDGVVVSSKNQSPTGEATLPGPELRTARVILTLGLAPPEGGWDGWDRGGSVYLFDENDVRYEIARFITPFRREYRWKVDVTDFQALLRGKRKFGLYISSWQGNGYKVTVDLDYYHGIPEREPYRVENLWVGSPSYGGPAKPFGDFFAAKSIRADRETRAAKVRFMVTGHGQVGEFTPAPRTVTINRTSFSSTLWKTDCYLNPVRPQSGTWKFDRAGWAPGDVVSPWEIDISRLIKPGRKIKISYQPHPYEGNPKGEASHWVESQIIFYRRPAD